MSVPVHRVIQGNGRKEPLVSALDRGFQLGDGVFSTLVSFGGKPFLLCRHLDRLLRHGAVIGLSFDRDILEKEVLAVAAETGDRHAILRITLTRGLAARGLWPGPGGEPTLVISAQPWSQDLVGQPARLVEAAIPRNQHSPLSRIKSLAYLENILAAREASEAGADDALIRNLDGHRVSSTIANIFAVENETLITPPLANGCLDGVMRGLVLEEAVALGLACREEHLGRERLMRANGLFLTNSVRFLRPVVAIDNHLFDIPPMAGQILSRLLRRVEQATSIELGKRPYFTS